MKDEERLRNCSRLEETKETQKLNAVYDPPLDPRPGKTISVKNIVGTIGEISIRSVDRMIVLYPC